MSTPTPTTIETSFRTSTGPAAARLVAVDPPSVWADVTFDLTITWDASLSTSRRIDASLGVSALSHSWDGSIGRPSLSPHLHEDRWAGGRYRFLLRAGRLVVGRLADDGTVEEEWGPSTAAEPTSDAVSAP